MIAPCVKGFHQPLPPSNSIAMVPQGLISGAAHQIAMVAENTYDLCAGKGFDKRNGEEELI